MNRKLTKVCIVDTTTQLSRLKFTFLKFTNLKVWLFESTYYMEGKKLIVCMGLYEMTPIAIGMYGYCHQFLVLK